MKKDENFLLGLCQMATRVAKEENLRQAQQMVQQAAQEGCRLVVLPEMFSCPYQAALFPKYAEPAEGETVSRMSAWARESGVVLVGGSIPECDEAGRVYNTSFVFDEQGVLLGRHRKMHLFDVDIAGGTCFRESDTLTAGNELTLCETSVGVLGVGICYDMRFGAMAAARGRFVDLSGCFWLDDWAGSLGADAAGQGGRSPGICCRGGAGQTGGICL